MTEPLRFPVAIVGAADLPALQEFLVQADGGIAYLIVAPDLPPGDPAALLQPHTTLPVHLVNETADLAPDHIYILPHLHTITRVDLPCQLHTVAQVQSAPMDACCKLLAPVLGAYALAVVLAGAGADGALGLTHIREAGGLAAVQDPSSTNVAAMPSHALAAGPADLVLPAGALASALAAYARRLTADPPWAEVEALPELIQGQMQHIQAYMLRQVGHDLSVFDPLFLLRKVQKRRRLLALPDLDAYVRVIDEHRHEAQLLRQEVLSSARQFCREPHNLLALAENVLAPILHAKGSADQVRVWVAGCTTGEEAYTLGILLLETAAAFGKTFDIRLFATDFREEAIREARGGLFPATIAADLGADRLRRYFTPEGEMRRISQMVRDPIIFAPHNLFHTPPFLKLDLIVCRNLLHTLKPERQQQLLGLFHQSLLPSGYLFTGSGELAPADFFRALGPDQPIYQRQLPAAFDRSTASSPFPTVLAAASPKPLSAHELLYSRHLQKHTPPGLLVDADLNIVYYSAGVSLYLHQPGGAATEQVLQRVRPELHGALSSALVYTAQTGAPACSQPVTLAQGGQRLQIYVEALRAPGQQEFLLVLFRPVEPPAAAVIAPDEAITPHWEVALSAAHAHLHATSEEYVTMTEEMNVTNEELLSLNEELHLKAAELERSREELQAANEELLAINYENQRNLEQLRLLTTNLQNLMAATNLPTLFLDSALQIRWFSPALQVLFNVLPGDEGRPLAHITHHLHHDRLAQDAAIVMASAEARELEIGSDNNAWYFMRILPYLTSDGRIDGVVMTFFDVTQRQRADEALRLLNASLEQRIEERTLELARSNRELDQFANVASHDLKAPLRAITNLAEWIQKDNAGALSPASQEHLIKLRNRIARMERLLDDLLSYSRLGRQQHKPEWVDIKTLVTGLRHVLLAPGGFRIELQEPLPALYTERVPLEIVLRNLIGNAIKHHDRPQEGVIQIAASENDEWVEFAVKDNGPGIAPQFHERIFQIFQSLRPRDEVGGSGMGLAIVKKAVECQGGWIRVESQGGQGATFRFSWPKIASQ